MEGCTIIITAIEEVEVKEDGEYKEGGEKEEAPTQNKRSQRCSL